MYAFKFRLSWLPVMFFFYVHYQQVIKWLLSKFGVISTWNFRKTTNCTFPTGSFNFVLFEKFTRANWHQIHSKSFSYLYLLHGCVDGKRQELRFFFLKKGKNKRNEANRNKTNRRKRNEKKTRGKEKKGNERKQKKKTK